MEADRAHRVAALVAQVKSFYARREPFRVYHGSTNSTRVLEFDRHKMVDTSAFNQVLSVDAERRVAYVEANVPMDALVRATLRHGLIPPVVMEFPGITVAGGLQGGAAESSSFKMGCFNRTLNFFDMVLGNGELVRASREEHADLFWGAAGAYGTLGVVTTAEVQLIPAARYVEVDFVPVASFGEGTEVIRAQAARGVGVTDGPDFVDGIMFAADRGVIMVGRLVDTPRTAVRRCSRARDEWFYLQAEALARSADGGASGRPKRVAWPIQDYLFRYDRGAFWAGMHAFKRFGMPFNRFTRWLLAPVMSTRKMYEALQASGVSQEFVIQDLALPAARAVEFLEYVDQDFGFYPLWLCPLELDAESPFLSRPVAPGPVINVGVWGFLSRDYEMVVKRDRELETKVQALGGRKWLYAYARYTADEFWQIYDKDWYTALRKKYHAETLPTIFEKIGGGRRQVVHGRRGVVTALLGRRGIRVRDSAGPTRSGKR